MILSVYKVYFHSSIRMLKVVFLIQRQLPMKMTIIINTCDKIICFAAKTLSTKFVRGLPTNIVH